MSCNTLIDPVCRFVGHSLHSFSGSVAGGVIDQLASAINAGVRWVVINTATLWVHLPSPGLSGEPAVTHIQQWLLPITAAVAVGAVIAAGTRMALTRRANPLLDVTSGLLTLAAASTVGVTLAALLLKAGDAWSSWVLEASSGDHFAQRLALALELDGSAAVAVVFGVLAIVGSLIQAVLMLFRQAALVILAGVLPLAAAGAIAPMTRAWVRKVTAWMLALIFYKPAAAAVYAAAFTMIGNGHSPEVALMGFVMLLLSVLALPALMKFFTWATGSVATPGGGGGQLFGAATVGAIAVGAMRPGNGGGGSAAQDQASYLDSRLGPPPGGSAGPSAPSPAGPGPGGAGGGSASRLGGGSGAGSPAGSGTAPSNPPQPQPWPGARPAWASTTPNAGAAPAGAAASEAAAANGPATPADAAAGGGTGPAAASSGSGAAAAGASAATGAGAAATVAAEAAKAAASSARLAAGAMEPGDEQ
jgi:hypothetical protein